MADESRQRTRQYPRRGSIYWERRDETYIASEHTAQTEGRGETPHEAIRDYLRQLEQ
jgi:hypothetical protein